MADCTLGRAETRREHFVVEQAQVVLAVAGKHRIQRDQGELLGLEAKAGMPEIEERAREESGADQQGQRQGDLSGDEKTTAGHATAGDLRRFTLERGDEVNPAGRPGRREPAQHTGDDRHERGETEHAQVGRDLELGRGVREQGKCARAPQGEQQAERATRRGQQQRFDQELPRDAQAPGAEREPQRHLPLPCRRPREHQVADVHTDEHQDNRDERGEDDERLPEVATEGWAAPAAVQHLQPFGRILLVRELRAKAVVLTVQHVDRLFVGHSGLQSSDNLKPPFARAFEPRCAPVHGGLQADGDPQADRRAWLDSIEPRGRDTDDRHRLRVEAKGSTNHRGISAEAALPVAVAEDDHRVGAG